MKLSTHLSLIVLLSFSTVQAACAQEDGARGMARFNFAPHKWKAEHSDLSNDYYPEPQHNVHAGSVPTGNALGLDPMMLSKPAPTPPVVATALTPRVTVPQTNASFNPAFGRPGQMSPVIPLKANPGHINLGPQTPPVQPLAAKPAQAAKSVVATGLRGSMKKPAYAWAQQPTHAAPAIASYAPGMGYIPGAVLASPSNRGGMAATTSVSATILSRKHK